MRGGIYSNQRCPICGGHFHDTGNGLRCPMHTKQYATRFVVRFGKITKNFTEYDKAFRFLTGLRFKTDEHTFDERDYKKHNPLGFSNQADAWLASKEAAVRARTHKSLTNHMDKAKAFFGNGNVKEIRKKHLEEFRDSLTWLSGKTKHNVMSTMREFIQWFYDREELYDIPKFPEVSFELGYRKTIDKETQTRIIEEVRRIASHQVWLLIKLLARYISVRPEEMRSLKWENVDEHNGYLFFPYPKEKEHKAVPVLKEDMDAILALGRGVPSMPVFSEVKYNRPYKVWKRACKNLKIEGVDLYGGTRHSSARALRLYHTPEEIKRATMHSTNKAFERYFTMEGDDLRSIYKHTADVIDFNNALITRQGGDKE